MISLTSTISRPDEIFGMDNCLVEVCSTEFRPAEVRHYLRMIIPPFIPLLNAFLEYFEMFGIRHRRYSWLLLRSLLHRPCMGYRFDALRFVLSPGRRGSDL
jgi:hypothetical protein